MAGGISKTLGGLVTATGALFLIVGLTFTITGLDVLGDESRKFLPDEGVLGAAAARTVLGLSLTALSFLLLFIGVPLLVYGLHRYADPVHGQTVTMRGGALKAWGVSLVILSALSLSVGAFAAGYGEGIVAEEMSRLVPHEPRGEAGAYLAVGGLILLVGGVVLLIPGAAFLIGGAARASGSPAGASAASWTAGRTALTLVGSVAILAFVLMAAFGQGADKGAFALMSDGDAPDGTKAAFLVEAPLEGRVRGASLPGLGSVGAGEERAVHSATPGASAGTIEVVGGWTSTAPVSNLLVILETETKTGEWQEIARMTSDGEILMTSGLVLLPGDVRVVFELPQGSAGDVTYKALLRIVPG